MGHGEPSGSHGRSGGSQGVLCGLHAATDLPSCLGVGSGSILIAQRRVEEGECKLGFGAWRKVK